MPSSSQSWSLLLAIPISGVMIESTFSEDGARLELTANRPPTARVLPLVTPVALICHLSASQCLAPSYSSHVYHRHAPISFLLLHSAQNVTLLENKWTRCLHKYYCVSALESKSSAIAVSISTSISVSVSVSVFVKCS